MEYQQKYYHGHMPAQFTVMDIYYKMIQVERIDAGKILEGGVLLGLPVLRILIENDGTVVLMTTPPPMCGNEVAKFHFHGSQFWEILHNDERGREQPNPEYAGELEAQLVYIRQISKNWDREMPYTYHTGGIVMDLPSE